MENHSTTQPFGKSQPQSSGADKKDADFAPLINCEELNELRNLLGEAASALVSEFEQQAGQVLAEISALLEGRNLNAADRQRIKDIVHWLKGSALSLHCSAVVDVCEKFELANSATSTDDYRILAAQLTGCLRSSLTQLSTWAAGN